MAWTDEMVDELKKLWSEGVTTSEIGRRLGISKNSIVGKVHRLGLEGRPSPIKRKDENEAENKKVKKASKAEDKSVKSEKKAEKTCKAKSLSKNEKAKANKNEEIKLKPKNKEIKAETKAEKKADSPKEDCKNAKKAVEVKPAEEKKADKPCKTDKCKCKCDDVDIKSMEEDIKLVQSFDKLPKEKSKKEFVSLTDLDNHTCRWPIGDPKDENFHFCGKKVHLGQTYCEEHAAMAYVKPIRKQ